MIRFILALVAALFIGHMATAQEIPMATTPAPAASPEDILVFELSTGGTVKVEMRPDKGPGHVARIKELVRSHFYDGTIFHRVIDGFMAQGGDPTGTGMGGSKLPNLKAEFNDLPHLRGVASMARSQSPESANSQFFIVLAPSQFLDGQYTAWGRVSEGMDAVDGIAKGEPPANPTKIVKAYVLADVAKKDAGTAK